jgi:hypothetical protein
MTDRGLTRCGARKWAKCRTGQKCKDKFKVLKKQGLKNSKNNT